MQKRSYLFPTPIYGVGLFLFSALFFLAAFQIRQVLVEKGVLATSSVWNGFIIALFGIGFILVFLGVISLRRPTPLPFFFILEKVILSISKQISVLIVISIYFFYSALFLLNQSFLEIISDSFPRLLFLCLCSLIVILLLQKLLNQKTITKSVVALYLLVPILLVICERTTIGIASINNIPFSTSWAESSHLYFSSAVFGQKIYGFSVPMYPYNQTRYIMQSLPFLISGLPIWAHRAWQLSLDLGIVLIFGWFLQRRLGLKDRLTRIVFLAFCFLWLSQIYIYYHLVVIALLIIAFYSNEKCKRNLLVILAASIWAGFSRVNWIPVPGLLAAFLYFLETKYDQKATLIEYLKKPFLYVLVGGITGFFAQLVYIQISGNNSISSHTAIFRSLLLWYRLLPNPTFRLGILPGILLISGMMVIFITKYFLFNNGIIWQRRSLVAIILMTFFVGGLVVSVKIGGGNNLHNMDAYSVFLLVLAGYVYSNKIKNDYEARSSKKREASQLMLVVILLTPVIWSIFFPVGQSDSKMTASGAQEVVRKMNEIINTYAKDRKVLFISQRQLIAFNYLQKIKMIPDFEQELLMEMVMSRDRQRLDAFYQQLIDHSYEVIVSYPLNTKIVGGEMSYAEENNLWVDGVARHIYNRYQTIALFPDYGIEMLIPKSG